MIDTKHAERMSRIRWGHLDHNLETPYTVRIVDDFTADQLDAEVGVYEYLDRNSRIDTFSGMWLNDWQPWDGKLEALAEFYRRLENDIALRGVVNPICVWSFPTGLFIRCGFSRAYIADKRDIACPALVSDWTDNFSSYPRCEEPVEYLSVKPLAEVYGEYGWWYNKLSDRHSFGPV